MPSSTGSVETWRSAELASTCERQDQSHPRMQRTRCLSIGCFQYALSPKLGIRPTVFACPSLLSRNCAGCLRQNCYVGLTLKFGTTRTRMREGCDTTVARERVLGCPRLIGPI